LSRDDPLRRGAGARGGRSRCAASGAAPRSGLAAAKRRVRAQGGLARGLRGAGPVEFRRVGPLQPNLDAGDSLDHVTWLSLRAGTPGDSAHAQGALVFLACSYAHWEFERRLGEHFDYARFALLAHDVRVHRAARPEGWLLLHARSQIIAPGRARGERRLFTRDGTLLASVTSEALVGGA
jgi:acyl-CoA thioesterase